MYTFDLTLIQQWAALVIAIGAAIGVLWVPTKWLTHQIVKRYRKCKLFLTHIETTSNRVQEIYPMVIRINEEMKPNGGSSLRDAINRMEFRTAVNELRLRLVTESNDQISFETDAFGSCKWVSSQWEKVYGIAASDALGRGWINGICFGDRDNVVAEWERAVKDKRKYELTYRANPDDPTWVYCEAYPMLVNGQVQGWVGYVVKVQAPSGGQVG